MDKTTARAAICRVGRSLFERGYVPAIAGNISVALEESEAAGFVVTTSEAP